MQVNPNAEQPIMITTTSEIRKAAILIGTVDPETANMLLAQMSPEEAASVRRAAVELHSIDADEREEILDEFAYRATQQKADAPDVELSLSPRATEMRPAERLNRLVPDRHTSGIDLCGTSVKQLNLPNQNRPRTSAAPSAAPAGLEKLNAASADDLAMYLRGENPQTIAVVFSHLDPNQAADVLARLPKALQVEVVRRLSHLDETSAETIREIELGLESWITEQIYRSARRSAGIAAVARIVSASSGETQQELLGRLAEEDNELTRRLEAKVIPQQLQQVIQIESTSELERTASPSTEFETFTWSDVTRLSDRALARLLVKAHRELIVLALAGSDEAFSARAFNVMDPAVAKVLDIAVRHLGPTRLSDMDTAKSRLAELAAEMAIEERNGHTTEEPHERFSAVAA